MSDINAPLPYAEPAEDGSSQENGIGLLVLLATGLAIAAVALAMVNRDSAEPFVLAVLGGLSVVGVFALFAGAVGILRFGERAERNDITKSLVDNLPQGALVTTPQGKLIYANEAYSRIISTDEDEGVIAIDRALAGEAHVSEQIFRLTRAARRGGFWEEEFALYPDSPPGNKQSGQPQWLRVSVRQIPARQDKRSRGANTLWLVSDITLERKNQDGAFESLQQMVGYLDGAPAGFITANRSGKITYMNATMARWLRGDLSEIADGKLSLSDIIFGESSDILTKPVEGAGQRAKREMDLDLVRRDGTSFSARILHRPPAKSDGAGGLSHLIVLDTLPAAGTGTGAPVTKAQFSRLFHSTPIAVATVDDRRRIVDTNRAFSRMFTDSGEQFDPGKTALAELVAIDEQIEVRKALDAARSGQMNIDPVDLVFGDNGERSGRFYFSSTPALDDEPPAVIVHAIDTTEQRALELQFAQSQKMQAVGQLAGGIAHDFNNVLTAIIGFSDLLLANHRPTDPAFQDIMNIKQNANRAAGLVRQLLAFSRQQTLRPQVLQLGDVLSELSILLDRLLGENVELSLDTAGDLWPVKADLHQFEQVIVNLAVNARDAMPDGGKLSIRTANLAEAESREVGGSHMPAGEYVMIEVCDTGTGMTEEVKQKIFEPFFSTKEIGRGTGLGLSTVYGIIKQTGGYVYVDSELGEGTAMRVILPRYEEGSAEVDQEPAKLERKPEKPKDLTGSGTLLLVEDEDAVRSFAARALGTRGYEVLQASTGAEALEVFEEHEGKVDLVVSDVVMPEMDGPTLMKELRKKVPDMKFVFMSGYAEDAFKRNLDENETFTFLQKPFDLKTLAATVKSALEG